MHARTTSLPTLPSPAVTRIDSWVTRRRSRRRGREERGKHALVPAKGARYLARLLPQFHLDERLGGVPVAFVDLTQLLWSLINHHESAHVV